LGQGMVSNHVRTLNYHKPVQVGCSNKVCIVFAYVVYMYVKL